MVPKLTEKKPDFLRGCWMSEEVGGEGAECWHILCHVHGKQFNISCGDALQRVKWLGHVAIARWDEENQQGWKRLGVPTIIRHKVKDGVELELGAIIKDVLQNGDQLYITTSLQPHETK